MYQFGPNRLSTSHKVIRRLDAWMGSRAWENKPSENCNETSFYSKETNYSAEMICWKKWCLLHIFGVL